MAKFGEILFFADLVVGLYFINLGIKFVVIPLPESFSNWIIILGGGLLVLGGLMSIMSSRRSERYGRR